MQKENPNYIINLGFSKRELKRGSSLIKEFNNSLVKLVSIANLKKFDDNFVIAVAPEQDTDKEEWNLLLNHMNMIKQDVNYFYQTFGGQKHIVPYEFILSRESNKIKDKDLHTSCNPILEWENVTSLEKFITSGLSYPIILLNLKSVSINIDGILKFRKEHKINIFFDRTIGSFNKQNPKYKDLKSTRLATILSILASLVAIIGTFLGFVL